MNFAKSGLKSWKGSEWYPIFLKRKQQQIIISTKMTSVAGYIKKHRVQNVFGMILFISFIAFFQPLSSSSLSILTVELAHAGESLATP